MSSTSYLYPASAVVLGGFVFSVLMRHAFIPHHRTAYPGLPSFPKFPVEPLKQVRPMELAEVFS